MLLCYYVYKGQYIKGNFMNHEIKLIENNLPSVTKPSEENTHEHYNLDFLHANPKVHEMVCAFNDGEMKHTIGMCKICFECRPIFNTTVSNLFQNKTPAEVPKWNLKDDICQRCLKDTKTVHQVPKYSGINSSYLKETKSSRHNNMHFEKVPPFLMKLTFIEQLLIRKITVALYIHTLKYGILASKGHAFLYLRI